MASQVEAIAAVLHELYPDVSLLDQSGRALFPQPHLAEQRCTPAPQPVCNMATRVAVSAVSSQNRIVVALRDNDIWIRNAMDDSTKETSSLMEVNSKIIGRLVGQTGQVEIGQSLTNASAWAAA